MIRLDSPTYQRRLVAAVRLKMKGCAVYLNGATIGKPECHRVRMLFYWPRWGEIAVKLESGERYYIKPAESAFLIASGEPITASRNTI